ncbi:MAG: DedA family protein [Acidobacteria bacterium]|nr:DedA family protein [Acidobacteriota bacterium]MBI3425386.1 DedA family protein [Acidobacteriota bacterium]
MKSFVAKLTAWLKSVQAALIAFGAFGIFTIALLDASFLPLPGGPDAVVMTLSHLNHTLMPLYVLAAVLGSTLGCLLPYWIGYKTGAAALRKFSPERRDRVSQLLDRYDTWAMLVGAILPPPFPFKIFLISAGVFRVKVWRFLLALFIGRCVRYGLEGWMAVRYGEHAADLFKQHYPKIGLVLAAVIIVFLIVNTLRNRKNSDDEGGELPDAV